MGIFIFMIVVLPTYIQKSWTSTKSVWRPTFGGQISWRSDLPFRNYSGFKFCAYLAWKCLFTSPKWSFGEYDPLNGEQCQRDTQRHILEWFHVERHIDWLDILSRQYDLYKQKFKMAAVAICWILPEVVMRKKTSVEWCPTSTFQSWFKYLEPFLR